MPNADGTFTEAETKRILAFCELLPPCPITNTRYWEIFDRAVFSPSFKPETGEVDFDYGISFVSFNNKSSGYTILIAAKSLGVE